MMDDHRVTSPHHSSLDDALPFDSDPSCLIDFGLHCVAADARSAVLAIDEGPRAVELAQLVLDVEKLRRKHAEHCPECGAEGRICPS
jgi:hypothetical protein